MFDSKVYIYDFKNCTSKELTDKISYTASVSKSVDVEFKDNNIIIKNKNIGRKNNSAFVGKIIDKNTGCQLKGSIPDEKSNKIMIIFFLIWYCLFVFFTFGKMPLNQAIIYYILGFVFLSGLIYVFFSTQKKALSVVKEFINDLKVIK